jgi:hypothetical protein
MSPMPAGWWVLEEGPNVVVGVPQAGRHDDVHVITADEARALMIRLDVVYALAERNRRTTGAEPGATANKVSTDREDSGALSRMRRDAAVAQVVDELGRLLTGLAPLLSGGWTGQA